MKVIQISDVTMKQAAEGFSLSFKEKIELAKLLDRLDVDVIELEGIQNSRSKSLASSIFSLKDRENPSAACFMVTSLI